MRVNLVQQCVEKLYRASHSGARIHGPQCAPLRTICGENCSRRAVDVALVEVGSGLRVLPRQRLARGGLGAVRDALLLLRVGAGAHLVLGRILGRPPSERPFVLVPIGYPAEGCVVPEAALRKKPLEEIMIVR